MKKILCFGDSNTFGYNPKDGTRYDKSVRWTGVLSQLCGNDFEVIEAGCNNRTAFSDNPDSTAATGYKILPKYLSPDLNTVILSIGINDLQKFYNPDFSEIEKGIEGLIKTVYKQSPNADILLVSPSAISNDILTSYFGIMFDKVSIEKSLKLPPIYEQIAKRYNCKFIDLNKIVKVSPKDGLHYPPEAHKRIAEELYKQFT